MTEIKTGKAIIPIHDGDIGISASGGADSSALLYVLMSHMNPKNHIHIYCFGRASTHYSTIAGSRALARRISDLTGFTNYTIHADYDNEQNKSTLFRAPNAAICSGLFERMYTGITADPPREVAFSWQIPTDNGMYKTHDEHVHQMRDPTVHREPIAGDLIMPFTNLNKQDIADIYTDLGIIETVYPYTRSCESYDPRYLGTHCGTCWWCQERVWGFGKL